MISLFISTTNEDTDSGQCFVAQTMLAKLVFHRRAHREHGANIKLLFFVNSVTSVVNSLNLAVVRLTDRVLPYG